MVLLNDILVTKNGAIFYRADLQIHTPASNDLDRKAKPSDIIQTILIKGLDIIAITDHNTTEWCERIKNAAKGSQLVVLQALEVFDKKVSRFFDGTDHNYNMKIVCNVY